MRFVKGGVFGLVALFCLSLSSCSKPDQDVQFRSVRDVGLDLKDGNPILTAQVVFYNPNKVSARVKQVDLEISVNDKKQGTIHQKLNQKVPAEAEFSVPLVIQLERQSDQSLLSNLAGLLGGKKYKLVFQGTLKLSYHGFPVKIPVNRTEVLQLR